MKYTTFALGLLCSLGFSVPATAQFSFTLNPTSNSISVGPGGTAIFGATLSNSSTTDKIFLDGINVTLTNNLFTTWADGGSKFDTNAPLSLNTAPSTSTPYTFTIDRTTGSDPGLFAVRVANNTPDGNYTGNVAVDYRVGSNPTVFTARQSFSVSKTPTPPVVLVTLFGGIGTVRMALRRRKQSV